MAHAALLEAAALHCLAAGHHVVLEGIFRADRYAAMIERIAGAADEARFSTDDLAFDETVVRHAGRPQAAEFTAEQMQDWYRGWDPLPFVSERLLRPDEDLEAIVGRVVQNR